MTNYEWLLQMGGDERKAWFDAEHNDGLAAKSGASVSSVEANDGNVSLKDSSDDTQSFTDSREKLEADVRKSLGFTTKDVFGWLDRQAAITEREIFDEMPYIRDKMRGLKAQVDRLTADLHASNREREHLRNQLGIALDHAHDICSLVDLDGNVLS